jgi:hypothetical protein
MGILTWKFRIPCLFQTICIILWGKRGFKISTVCILRLWLYGIQWNSMFRKNMYTDWNYVTCKRKCCQPVILFLFIYLFKISFNIIIPLTARESRDSSVSIALGYGLEDRGSRVRFPVGAGNFSFTTASRTALGPSQPPIQWVPWSLSLG